MPTLKELTAERGTITVKVLRNDAAMPYEERDEWQRKATGYRCQIRYTPKHEKGTRAFAFDFWHGSGIRETPDERPLEVLDSLLSDASAEENFEDFCSEFGYDSDSRKAEKTHKACLKIKREMKRLLGSDFESFLYAERE